MGIDLRRLWQWLLPEKHPALKENRRAFRKLDTGRPIEEYEFVSMDTELTGLDRKTDAIVSLGAVRIRGLRIQAGENFFSYVYPTAQMPKVSTLIHRITPEQIKNAPQLEEILPDFIEWCGSALFVGHFVALDVGFLNRACSRFLGGKLANPSLDSLTLAQHYCQIQRSYYDNVFVPNGSFNLGQLARQYGLPAFDEHDALEDAFQAACLFLFLVRKLQASGFSTLRDFLTASRRGARVF
ncbi:MAG: 3'-5' exonuclease [Thermodesulfobacteriota bacterium]